MGDYEPADLKEIEKILQHSQMRGDLVGVTPAEILAAMQILEMIKLRQELAEVKTLIQVMGKS